jgi:hypothetical protein
MASFDSTLTSTSTMWRYQGDITIFMERCAGKKATIIGRELDIRIQISKSYNRYIKTAGSSAPSGSMCTRGAGVVQVS